MQEIFANINEIKYILNKVIIKLIQNYCNSKFIRLYHLKKMEFNDGLDNYFSNYRINHILLSKFNITLLVKKSNLLLFFFYKIYIK